ncbi:MAG: M3 family oligoendopeptidase [Planctomycetes bacterium]|nr:M3 family oligoendopeptidase [Planctomycetota bacterium]MCL4728904.1 M3 family oligoendopeptidase [Planctomycetota bacterium]
MQAARPTLDVVKAEMAAIETAFDSARDAAARLDAIRRWDALRGRIGTWASLVGLRFNQDTRNEQYRKDRDYRDELTPRLTNLHNAFKRKLLASPHRAELEAAFGRQAFALWDQDARSHAPEIERETVEISRLGAEYTEMLAAAKFEFRGESLTMSGLGKYTSDPDRDTRHEAQRMKWQWFADHRARLDEIFDRLTRLRHDSARKLGLKDFVELGYLRMHRVDYTRADVENLRKQVRDEVVPLCAELVKRQAKTLGIPKVMFWDDGIHEREGNPRPRGDHDWMVARATEMFDDMGHGLGEFFRLMTDRGLMDLKSREGKAGGGFCTSFPDWGVPFIFANFNGTKGDVEVFTHEMGHAFQSYSSRRQPLHDYHWPTHESAEIHSMSLEFFTWPWMDRFFNEDAQRFRRVHLTGSLLFIPYGTAVDHFQHLVYETPDATPAQRHEMWRQMERTYLPWRDYGDLPHVTQGGFWQQQRHIYLSPFYYIDYVLAQVCALQFWVRSDQDRASAMRDYVRLCGRGGEAPFGELARGAGLRSPFEQGCLSAVVAKARDWLAGQG